MVLTWKSDKQIDAGLLQSVLEEWNSGSHPVVMVHARDRVASDEFSAFRAFVTTLFPSAPFLAAGLNLQTAADSA